MTRRVQRKKFGSEEKIVLWNYYFFLSTEIYNECSTKKIFSRKLLLGAEREKNILCDAIGENIEIKTKQTNKTQKWSKAGCICFLLKHVSLLQEMTAVWRVNYCRQRVVLYKYRRPDHLLVWKTILLLIAPVSELFLPLKKVPARHSQINFYKGEKLISYCRAVYISDSS